MKLHPLLLLPAIIAPILSMSLPAQSDLRTPVKSEQSPDGSKPNPNPNPTPAPQQIDQVIDFGSRGSNVPNDLRAFRLIVAVPEGHSKFVITPPNPFDMNTFNGQIDANRNGQIAITLNPSGLSRGNHQRVVTILTEKKLIIKRVLLKVSIR
jgi:hypothetical protein